MEYKNYCYNCGKEWTSDIETDACPECGEIENIGTDSAKTGDY